MRHNVRRRALRELWNDRSGLALLEFALVLPILLSLGGFGVEGASLALVNLRVSQVAMNLADNASRVGLASPLAKTQLREVDVNDVLQAARLESSGINLTTNGRITLSSLENIQQSYDTAPVQRIHWQRCAGLKAGTGYDSTYGRTTATAGTDATSGNAGVASSGMGDSGAAVSAPPASGVMFVEVNYDYQPVFGSLFQSLFATRRIRYVASFIVRDKRDYSRLFNPAPAAVRSTCDLYAK
ncbi:pilus assembly protein [Sphingomonas gei]|uniref:Pilus assembly protein n=1 Tax=Sphingomonas gei TaxID=1395960 RepID=A0A4S1XAJ6_9SPHN|nr:TadE/TadG family type IV pilus assembly protein [Sphingomonas gei]TGX52795.1 pilus assembly protein [Sphingomonas gei]